MESRSFARLGIALALAGLVASVVPPAAQAESRVATSCAGTEADGRGNDFTAWQGVSRPVRVTRVHQVGKAAMHRTAGVEWFVPSQPGLSREELARVVTCHVAMADQRDQGHPLAVPGLKAKVTGRGTGYRVTLTTDDVAAAQELVRRVGL